MRGWKQSTVFVERSLDDKSDLPSSARVYPLQCTNELRRDHNPKALLLTSSRFFPSATAPRSHTPCATPPTSHTAHLRTLSKSHHQNQIRTPLRPPPSPSDPSVTAPTSLRPLLRHIPSRHHGLRHRTRPPNIPRLPRGGTPRLNDNLPSSPILPP